MRPLIVLLAAAAAAVGACATAHIPQALHGYEVVVEGKDEQSVELARVLRASGLRVRGSVRGGSGPTAALIFFTFRDPAPGEETWLHVRLADTRSGVIVGISTILLDTATVTPRARAKAAIAALVRP